MISSYLHLETKMASASKTEVCVDDGGVKKGNVGLMSRMEINDNKAGMEGLDKEKINQIIFDASKGSKFYEMERKKEEQLNVKIEKLKLYADQINNHKMNEGKFQADLLLDKLQLERDLSHTIVHVDMDAFYAAVEMKDAPSLKSKPMAVGGMGMLSTSNYLARKFGVRAAMPGFIGLKLCPNLVIVKPNFDKYKSVCHEIRKILALYDPNFCPMSLDEAYLDFGDHMEYRRTSLVTERTFILRQASELNCSGTVNGHSCESPDQECQCDLNDVLLPSVLNSEVLFSLINHEVELYQSYIDSFDSENVEVEGILTVCQTCKKSFPSYKLRLYGLSIEEAVLEMRNRIEQRTRLTASAGIAPNMMLAKICSDKNKPNGQYTISPDVAQINAFIQDLPIRKVSGIGKVTEKLLGGLDVIKCSDIYDKRGLLYHLFSPTSFHHFLLISLGMGSTTVERDDERKSISTEQTFSEISDTALLCSKCEEMCQAVSDDMKHQNIKGKTVTLKLKTVSFEVKTRSQTIPESTNDASVIFHHTKKLLLTEIRNSQPAHFKLRLMGVRMSKLMYENTEQVTVNSLFNKYKGKERASSSGSKDKNLYPNSALRLEAEEDLQDQECEDFSQPLADVIHQTNSKGKMMQTTSTPHNQKKDTKKSDISSRNILNFFPRRDMKHNNSNNLALQACSSAESFPNLNVSETSLKTTSVESSSSYNKTTNQLETLDEDEVGWSNQLESPVDNLNNQALTCPICGKTNSEWDISSLNSHIDTCLSHRAIRDMLQHDQHNQGLKRTRLDDIGNQRIQRPTKARKIQSSVLSYFQP